MTVVYNIPISRLSDYRTHDLVVRSEQAQALVDGISEQQLQRVAYVQLLSLPTDIDSLIHWAPGLAIELVLESPAANFPVLYRYAKWLDNHPVRVAIPVEEGFEKAVKLALSLQFAVRLHFGQPDAACIQALAGLLDDYLHRPTVAQPLEFFHNVLLAFCRQEQVDFWRLQEDDPALIRYIDESGREQLPEKFNTAALPIRTEPAVLVDNWAQQCWEESGECSECDYFTQCRGYFKWPQRDYQCAGIKSLLQTLEQAADELRRDLSAAEAIRGANDTV